MISMWSLYIVNHTLINVVGFHISFFFLLIAEGMFVSGLDAGVDSFNTVALGKTPSK